MSPPRGNEGYAGYIPPAGGDVRIRVRAQSDGADIEKAVGELFGALGANLREHSARLREYEPRITEWLKASPENLRSFVEDPIGSLLRAFPELELPRPSARPHIPDRVKLEAEEAARTDPVALEIFHKLWQHVAASQANTQTFVQAPFAVIASVGSGYPPDKVDLVQRAFEAVFGIYRLQGMQPSESLAFAHAVNALYAAHAARRHP